MLHSLAEMETVITAFLPVSLPKRLRRRIGNCELLGAQVVASRPDILEKCQYEKRNQISPWNLASQEQEIVRVL